MQTPNQEGEKIREQRKRKRRRKLEERKLMRRWKKRQILTPKPDVRASSPGHHFPSELRARGEDGPIAGEARPYLPNRDDAVRAATVPDSTGSFMVLSSNTLGAQSVVSVNPAESLVASVASSDGVLVGHSTSSSSQGAHTQDMSTLAASSTVGHSSTPETVCVSGVGLLFCELIGVKFHQLIIPQLTKLSVPVPTASQGRKTVYSRLNLGQRTSRAWF